MKVSEDVQKIADAFYGGRRAMSYEEIHAAFAEIEAAVTRRVVGEILEIVNAEMVVNKPLAYAGAAIKIRRGIRSAYPLVEEEK